MDAAAAKTKLEVADPIAHRAVGDAIAAFDKDAENSDPAAFTPRVERRRPYETEC